MPIVSHQQLRLIFQFWDFGLLQVDMIGYQAQVIPAMLAGFMLAYLEIFFRKYIPQSISMIFVPDCSLYSRQS